MKPSADEVQAATANVFFALVIGFLIFMLFVVVEKDAVSQQPVTVLVIDETEDAASSLAVNSVLLHLRPLLPAGTKLEGAFVRVGYDLEIPTLDSNKLRFGRYDLIVVVPRRVTELKQLWVAACYPRYPIDQGLMAATSALQAVIAGSDLPGVSAVKVLTTMTDLWVGLLAMQFGQLLIC